MSRLLRSIVVLLIVQLSFFSSSCFAQYNAENLFQFSHYWQQEATNETSLKINFNTEMQINESDLLKLIEGRRSVDPSAIAIDLPGLPDQVKALVMVRIPAGSYKMGRYPGEQDSHLNEEPQHIVSISHDFYIGKYEVTQAQWQAVMGTTPWLGQDNVLNASDSPAVYVSWEGAQAFITALNQLRQGTFRLPSEAEWEYACRAGTTTRFYWGDDPTYSMLGDYAWYADNALEVGEEYAHLVGEKLPNGYGLYDMSGNVWEWCQDYWHEDYTDAPNDGSAWEEPISIYRVGCGGGWGYIERNCRSAARAWARPTIGYNHLGFRLVMEQ